jgi:cytoskeletal protein CcmA (bactofilin family)
MWKREEPAKLEIPTTGSGAHSPVSSATTSGSGGNTTSNRTMGREVVNIGKSVIIKGELSGSEDLTIEGTVEGQIELRDHVLTIGPNGKIKARVFAKSVIVMGNVTGNIMATEKINIRENGSVDGDITAPKIAITEGAQFRGSIDMQRQPVPQGAAARSASVESMKARATQSSDALYAKNELKSSSSVAPTPTAGAAF